MKFLSEIAIHMHACLYKYPLSKE